jgi:hypothetical protein
MVKLTYTRADIETLAERLEQRASSIILFDMPQLQRDMKAAAMLLRYMLTNGMPVTSAEIEINNIGTARAT